MLSAMERRERRYVKGAGHTLSSGYVLMRHRLRRPSHSQRLEALDADFKELIDMTVESKIRKAVMNDIVKSISQGEDIVSHLNRSPRDEGLRPTEPTLPILL
jgi:hypothetical protein